MCISTSHFDKLHVIIISYQNIFCRLLSLWTVSRLSFNWQCQILLWFHFLLSREGIFLEIFPCSEHLIWTRLVWSVSVKLIVANPHNLDECHKVSSRITQQYPNQAVTRILEQIAYLIWKDNRHKDIFRLYELVFTFICGHICCYNVGYDDTEDDGPENVVRIDQLGHKMSTEVGK